MAAKKLIYKYFNDDDFLKISAAIKEAEKITSGEIRVSIKDKAPFTLGNLSIREIAEKEFYRLKMDNTRDRTGILLLLLLKERAFYILADEGINSRVTRQAWDTIRDELQNEFQNGNFTNGIIEGINKISKILARHFPIKSDDTNELSNEVVI